MGCIVKTNYGMTFAFFETKGTVIKLIVNIFTQYLELERTYYVLFRTHRICYKNG